MFGLDKLFKTKKKENYDNTQLGVDPKSELPLYKNDIISYVLNEVSRRREERAPIELMWQLIANFVTGNQYCDINPTSMRIEDIEQSYEWMERETFNRMAPIFETRQAKLGRIKPIMKVRPATNEINDIAKAKVSSSVLRGTQVKLKYSELLSTANAWSDLLGTVFWINWWDSRAGKLIYSEEKIDIKEDGTTETVIEETFEGDLACGILTPYELYPDSLSNQYLNDCRSIIIQQVKDVDDIFDMFNVRLDGITIITFGIAPTMVTGGLDYNSYVNSVSVQERKNVQHLTTYMEKPSRDFPNGRLIIIGGETELLFYGDLPYKVGEDGKRGYPITKQECVRRPGCFYGTTPFERMIPVQRSYNAVKNRKHDYLNRCSIQAYTGEEGSFDEEDLQENGIPPGAIILRQRGTAPITPIQNSNLPPEFDNEEFRLQRELEYLSGISEMSVISSTPSGVDSGKAIEAVKESDDTRLSLTADNIRWAAIENGKHWLRLYKQFSAGARIIELAGSNEIGNVLIWDASDISSYDVVHETENELLDTPMQRREFLMSLVDKGFLHNEQGVLDKRTKIKLLEQMKLGNWEDVLDLTQLHISKAQRENAYLNMGIFPEIADFDEHALHIEEHNRFRLSTDYYLLKQSNPMMAQAIDGHVAQHEQVIAQAEQQQQLQQMMLQQQNMKG